MKVEFISGYRGALTDEQFYETGEIVDLPDNVAKHVIENGHAVAAEGGKAKAKEGGKESKSEPEPPSEAAAPGSVMNSKMQGG